MFKEMMRKRKIKKEMNEILDKWEYRDEKKLYVHDGDVLVEEMTFKEFVDRRIAEAKCDCRRERKHWERMLSSSQVYPLRRCCNVVEEE